MRKHIKFGAVVLFIYLVISIILYFGIPISESYSIINALFISINLILKLPGILLAQNFVPAQYCDTGFVGCADNNLVIFVEVIIGAIFYFLIGVLISFLFRRKK